MLCVVDPPRLRLEYYDPMPTSRNGADNGTAIGYILQSFQDKHDELRSGQPKLSFQVDRPACPEQHNTYDCGVFACQFANYLTSDVSDVPLDLTQADIPRC